MATKIEWVKNPDGTKGKTWNPIVGCTKVSPGCAHCYAEVMAKRLKAIGRPEYQDAVDDKGRWTGRVTFVPERLEEPYRTKKPTTYFVNSMSDLFHPDVPFEYIAQVYEAMIVSAWHTFQVLTKRAERMLDFYEWSQYRRKWAKNPPENIWIGVSTENQKTADERIPYLLKVPAAVRFVSAEPLLERINLNSHLDPIYERQVASNGNAGFFIKELKPISLVIAGCESGTNPRHVDDDAFRYLRGQCIAAGVNFFLKQMMVGGRLVKMPELDGQVWDQLPKGSN